MKKTIAFAAFTTFICAVTTSCTRSFQPPADTLVVALGSQPATLDPRFATDATGVRIANLIFNSFVRIGDNFNIVPEAAESWSVNGRIYTFQIRRDLKFHNGRPLRKEDLLYSWNFYRGPGSPYASTLKMIQSVAVIEQDGRLVMRVELRQPSASFLTNELPSIKILPAEEVEAAGADFNQVLIGTGPYRFVHQKLNEIRLKAVTAKTDNLIFKVIRDDFTRYQKMLKGEIDIAQNELPPDKIHEFQTRPDLFQVFTYPGLNMTYLLINLREPPLSDPRVRRAFAQALDRAEIIRYKLHGLAEAATSILTPQNPYFNSAVKNPPFAPELARSSIQALRLGSEPLILKTSNTPGAIDTGRVLAHQLQSTGMPIRHESFEWATYYDDIKKGNFQLATMKWVGIVDPEIYRSAFHSAETPPGRNRGYYKNPRLDQLLDQGMAEANLVRRKKIFDEVQSLVHADLPIIPLWYDVQVAVARSRVRDYVPVMTSDYWPLTRAYKVR